MCVYGRSYPSKPAEGQFSRIASAWSENGVSAGYGCSPLLGGPGPRFKLFVGHAGARPLLLFIALLVCEVGGVSSLRLLYQRGLVLGVAKQGA